MGDLHVYNRHSSKSIYLNAVWPYHVAVKVWVPAGTDQGHVRGIPLCGTVVAVTGGA